MSIVCLLQPEIAGTIAPSNLRDDAENPNPGNQKARGDLSRGPVNFFR